METLVCAMPVSYGLIPESEPDSCVAHAHGASGLGLAAERRRALASPSASAAKHQNRRAYLLPASKQRSQRAPAAAGRAACPISRARRTLRGSSALGRMPLGGRRGGKSYRTARAFRRPTIAATLRMGPSSGRHCDGLGRRPPAAMAAALRDDDGARKNTWHCLAACPCSVPARRVAATSWRRRSVGSCHRTAKHRPC
eukprot:scaffold23369_cov67-Phaeocystis_antarctica.AAC.3